MDLGRVIRVVLLIVAVGVMGFCMLSSCLMGAQRPVVSAIEDLFRDLSIDGWKAETFYPYTVEEFPEHVPPEELNNILRPLGHSLGRFQSLRTREFYQEWSASRPRTTILVDATFERGYRSFRFAMARVGGAWQIETFWIDP